jgi:Flp pilus assembly protein TadD
MGARLGFVLLGAAALGSGAPAGAQVAAERADDSLSRNLRLLAANPKSLTALMGAGKAAFDLGDPQAALTFFARAEEIAPRDGRIKLWIGSSLVQLQQPRSAMRFFKEAVDLGVAEPEVARERGLAHDIAGNPREAQNDYRLALQRGRDPEATRRLALSLAITGQREAALRLLEEQLLVRDPVAERTRALVLALVGDTTGAARVVSAAMPGQQGEAMATFLRRLPQLGQAERALAVHLGVFPTDGRTAPASSWASTSTTDAGRPDPGQVSLARRTTTPEPVSTAPRRRPGTEEGSARPTLPQIAVRRSDPPQPAATVPARTVSSQPAAPAASKPAPVVASAVKAPAASTSTAAKSPAPTVNKAPPPSALDYARGSLSVAAAKARDEAKAARTPASPPAAEARQETPVARTDVPASTVSAEPGFSLAPGVTSEPSPAAPTAQTATAQPNPSPAPAAEQPAPADRLASLAATLEEISEPAPKPAAPKAAAPAKPKPAAPPPAKKPVPAPEPARHWVQVAGGANKAGFPVEYARLKAKAPKLLGARAAFVTPANATNRLLVGPFDSAKDAQAFVNALAEEKLSAFAWQSAAGQKIEKLPAK